MKVIILILAVMLMGGCASGPEEGSSQTSKKDSSKDTPAQLVYVTNSGKKYHRVDCRFLSKSKVAVALAKARSSHSPCLKCLPPK